ncbi:MAG: hypothetical protein KAI66_22245 [Lentisphaeria bacterium]|nr:hypothetical protein [Lentisphaeria bacterium]
MRTFVAAVVISSASAAISDANVVEFALVDEFREGLKHWGADVGTREGTVVKGIEADPADGKALLFDHRKTDTSRVYRWFAFKPNRHYLRIIAEIAEVKWYHCGQRRHLLAGQARRGDLRLRAPSVRIHSRNGRRRAAAREQLHQGGRGNCPRQTPWRKGAAQRRQCPGIRDAEATA